MSRLRNRMRGVVVVVVVVGPVAVALLLGWTACRKAEPETTDIQVFLYDTALINVPPYEYGGMVRPVTRHVPASDDIAAAAVREMLKGPTPEEMKQGFANAMPGEDMIHAHMAALTKHLAAQPNAVLAPGSVYTHGAIELLGLRVEDGTAHADFSNEIHAYGGGTAAASLISAQIHKTLRQFAEIDRVIITVEGRGIVLQP